MIEANKFIVTSHGWSASNWLATALDLHKEITCAHSAGLVLPGAGGYDPRAEDAISKKNVLHGRHNYSLKDHFEKVFELRPSKVIGSVHRYRMRDLPNLLKEQHHSEAISFKLMNLVRHPVSLVSSGASQFTEMAARNPFIRIEIMNFFSKQRHFYANLADQFDLDLCDWPILSFLAAAQHQIILRHDQECMGSVTNILMERITTQPDYFLKIANQLVSHSIEIDEAYVDEVFSLGRVNRHQLATDEKVSSQAEDRFSSWADWQRVAFTHFLKVSKLQPAYEQLGYDFSFVLEASSYPG